MSWAESALDALKEVCMKEIRQDPRIAESDDGRIAAEGIEENSCVNECSGNGECIGGKFFRTTMYSCVC